jgi:hypothetical protein
MNLLGGRLPILSERSFPANLAGFPGASPCLSNLALEQTTFLAVRFRLICTHFTSAW